MIKSIVLLMIATAITVAALLLIFPAAHHITGH